MNLDELLLLHRELFYTTKKSPPNPVEEKKPPLEDLPITESFSVKENKLPEIIYEPYSEEPSDNWSVVAKTSYPDYTGTVNTENNKNISTDLSYELSRVIAREKRRFSQNMEEEWL